MDELGPSTLLFSTTTECAVQNWKDLPHFTTCWQTLTLITDDVLCS